LFKRRESAATEKEEKEVRKKNKREKIADLSNRLHAPSKKWRHKKEGGIPKEEKTKTGMTRATFFFMSKTILRCVTGKNSKREQ